MAQIQKPNKKKKITRYDYDRLFSFKKTACCTEISGDKSVPCVPFKKVINIRSEGNRPVHKYWYLFNFVYLLQWSVLRRRAACTYITVPNRNWLAFMPECLFIFSLAAGCSLTSSETKELHLLGVTDLYSALNVWPCLYSFIHSHQPFPRWKILFNACFLSVALETKTKQGGVRE